MSCLLISVVSCRHCVVFDAALLADSSSNPPRLSATEYLDCTPFRMGTCVIGEFEDCGTYLHVIANAVVVSLPWEKPTLRAVASEAEEDMGFGVSV